MLRLPTLSPPGDPMPPHRSPATAPTLLLLALALGALGDVLLRGVPWGVNVVLWSLALTAAALAALGRPRMPPTAALLLGLACLTAFLWRDAEFLQVWGVLALLAGLSLATAHAAGVPLAAMRVRDGVAAALESALRAAFHAAAPLTREIRWEALTRDGRWAGARAAAVGTALAIPVALVFGGLLRAAEPRFAALTDPLFGWDVPAVISHAGLTAFLGWIAAGYLHGLASRRPWMAPPPEAPGAPPLRLPHVAIPLGLLAAMLGLFAAIQAGYLFGGWAAVERTTGLTVAEYARRGFFELVAVATLVLATLLAVHAALDRASPATVRGYRAIALALIALVGVVLASALVRMRLYVTSFGLTEDRIYGTAFMLWVGVVLAWFAATMLRDRARRFAYGAVVAGFATLLALAALDPHGLIVRVNVARAAAGRELDVAYLNRLSADAVPAIAAAWPALDAEARCLLWRGRLRAGAGAPDGDWRTWNLARHRARQAASALPRPSCPAEGG